jgi:hypothetical protein
MFQRIGQWKSLHSTLSVFGNEEQGLVILWLGLPG